jgi:hypothetical protein
VGVHQVGFNFNFNGTPIFVLCLWCFSFFFFWCLWWWWSNQSFFLKVKRNLNYRYDQAVCGLWNGVFLFRLNFSFTLTQCLSQSIYRVYTKEWCGFNSEYYWNRTIILCMLCIWGFWLIYCTLNSEGLSKSRLQCLCNYLNTKILFMFPLSRFISTLFWCFLTYHIAKNESNKIKKIWRVYFGFMYGYNSALP